MSLNLHVSNCWYLLVSWSFLLDNKCLLGFHTPVLLVHTFLQNVCANLMETLPVLCRWCSWGWICSSYTNGRGKLKNFLATLFFLKKILKFLLSGQRKYIGASMDLSEKLLKGFKLNSCLNNCIAYIFFLSWLRPFGPRESRKDVTFTET